MVGTFLRYASVLLAAALGATTFFLICTGVLWNLTPATLDIQILQFWRTFLLVFIVAFVHGLLFGLPLGLLAQKLNFVSAAASAIGGFLVGALPISLLLALTPPPSYSSAGGVVTSIAGVRTLEGWLQIVKGAGLYGVCGVFGGLCAWAVWHQLDRRPKTSLGP